MADASTPDDDAPATKGSDERSPGARARKRAFPWRPWLRALHRDFGYAAVGLTVVYAVSGLAVNHLTDWDPNFVDVETRAELGHALPTDPDAAAAEVVAALHLTGKPDAVDPIADDELEVRIGAVTISANPLTGGVVAHERRARPLLRLANWLHLNRGKKAWTRIADAYAVLLLFLAGSGVFMLPGRKGLLGRGGVLVLLGALVPVVYVAWSGGP